MIFENRHGSAPEIWKFSFFRFPPCFLEYWYKNFSVYAEGRGDIKIFAIFLKGEGSMKKKIDFCFIVSIVSALAILAEVIVGIIILF